MARPAASRAAWILATAACLARASAQTTFNTANQLKNYAEGCAAPCEEASGWDISELTSLNSAFKLNAGFNGNISGWDVSNVQDMADMFFQAAAFDHDITGWDDSSVTSSRKMFDGATAWHVRFVRTDGGDAIDGPPSAFASRNCDPTAYAASGECECAANHRVASGACVACDAGYINAAGDVVTGADTTCGECAEGFHVSSGACVQCAADFINAAGDDATGADTTCTYKYCAENEHVSGGSCATCAAGYINAAGDDITGADTTCGECAENFFVSSNACVACAAGYVNAAGDDATGADTTCGECAEDFFVSSNACVACAYGYVNDAGDDAAGADTACTLRYCAENEYVSSGVCAPCAAGYVNAAGDDTRGGVDTACEPRPPALPRSFSSLAPSAPSRARAEYVAPPYLQRLFPDKGHVVGGTTVTIFGGGFVRGPHVTVRFSHVSGEVDVVPASVIDSGRVSCVTPERRAGPHVAHVSVSNDGATYTSFPLVTSDEGTYLHFTFADDAPKGRWTLDRSAGPAVGGTAVVIRNRDASDATRLHSDAAFLPGRRLRCRFGNARNVTDATTFNVTVALKTNQHPWFGVGDARGFAFADRRGSRGYSQGSTITLVRGRAYRFVLDASVAGFPFYFTTAEPSEWRAYAYLGEYASDAPRSRADQGVIEFRVALDAPDRLYYASGSASHMGGAANVVSGSLGAGFAPPEAANQNAVPAMWLSYNAIRCVTPPWDLHTDDDLAHGGKQVTVFVTNDGARYSAGFEETWDPHDAEGLPGVELAAASNGESSGSGTETPLPSRSGDGATFTYFDAAKFRDAPRFYPASRWAASDASAEAAAAVAGGPASTVGFDVVRFYPSYEFHSHSDVYDDRGRTREWHFNDTRLEATDDSGGLVFLGEHVGDGLAWYEVVAEGPSTLRWRIHEGAVNRTTPWVQTGVDAGDGSEGSGAEMTVTVTSSSPGPRVFGGVTARRRRIDASGGFEASNLVALSVGDRWTFRAYGGAPAVTSATTPHDEPSIPARGPFEGNTEITLRGHGFFPSEKNLLCRLHDGATGATQILPARFISATSVACVTEPHAPLGASFRDPTLGAKTLGTVAPCVYKTVQASNDGGATWSADGGGDGQRSGDGRGGADAARAPAFLFCDVHVSVSGSDVSGRGTPDRPYATIQRAVEAALGEARAVEDDADEHGARGGGRVRGEASVYTSAEEESSGDLASPSRRRFFGRGATRGGARRPGKRNSGGNDRGFSRCLNRDRIRLAPGVYGGNGNVAVHPLGKMLEVAAERRGESVVDCGGGSRRAVVAGGDRHGDVDGAGSLSMFGVEQRGCLHG